MKIRLMGTEQEVEAATRLIGSVFDVLEQSRPYANRADSADGSLSRLVRVYLDVDVPGAPALPRSSAGRGGDRRG